MAKIDQRKYLKKYLEDDHSDHRKKKKREHSESHSGRVKIIDDDAHYARKRNYEDDNDLILTGEDAPQVVGIIDDRPPELKTIEDFRSSGKWKSVPSTATTTSAGGERSRSDHGKEPSRRDRRRSPSSEKDYSPKRSDSSKRRPASDDYSPPRRKHERKVSVDKDLSPVRRRKNKSDDDLSPVRKDSSPIRRRKDKSDDDLSPVRKSKSSDKQQRSKSGASSSNSHQRRRKADSDNSSDEGTRMKRTLDGKRAGLQDAKTLKRETDEFRRREDEHFKKMSNDVSGRHADVVVREKRSGRVRDLEKDREKDKEKEQREKERKETYSRWGKGLKQVEDYRNKVSDEMHESSKPLARYSDDVDLDRLLKDQERIGDPMLNYIREKNAKASNVPKMPTYNGPCPENRFNIRPGYRWDGVDRSNGYEKKWFDVQNSKTALQEEAYKYSTEDM